MGLPICFLSSLSFTSLSNLKQYVLDVCVVCGCVCVFLLFTQTSTIYNTQKPLVLTKKNQNFFFRPQIK